MRLHCVALVVLSSIAAPACIAHDRDAAAHDAAPASQSQPRLIVQIVVDQLRGDIPFRYQDRLSEGGFRLLMDQGTWYTTAQHPHSHTETVVGHTTLSTAAFPSSHGMIANSWYVRDPVVATAATSDQKKTKGKKTGKPTKRMATGTPEPHHGMTPEAWAKPKDPPPAPAQSTGQDESGVEDSNYVIVGTEEAGASPERILTSTFSDELALSTAGSGKVFSVSTKDRAAVALGGHAGKAFWFSSTDGHFVSSTYYYDEYPPWVEAWNAQGNADAFKNQQWQLSHPRETYIFRDSTNQFPTGSPPEHAMEVLEAGHFGRVFPHTFAYVASLAPMYYTSLTISPVGDQLTASFAKALIESEKLGADEVTDYIGIGLSTFDIVNHWFSISSLESEDNFLRLDQTLEDLFAFLDAKVGLEHVLIVLSGDHGGPEFPENLEKLGIPTGRISPKDIELAATTALAAAYPSGAELVSVYEHPYFYFDWALIESQGLQRGDVEQTVVEAVMALDGVSLAVGATDLHRGGEEASAELIARIRRNQHPDRSGDVYVVQNPQWQVGEPPSSGEGPGGVLLLNHGSPWAYDRFVPIAFSGAGIPATKVAREVWTVDVAATLAALAGTAVPSGSVGTPLPEVLGETRTQPRR